MRLLATREHSRLELERKLQRHETAPGELARVLDALQTKGFIDEKRVVESVLHRRAGKLGVARIRQELQDKGLPVEVIRDAVAGLQGSELARARVVWTKKFAATQASQATQMPDASGDARAPDAANRARQIRYLAARGFAGDTIRRVVSGAGDWLDESLDD